MYEGQATNCRDDVVIRNDWFTANRTGVVVLNARMA